MNQLNRELRPAFFRSRRWELELAGDWTQIECHLGFLGSLDHLSGMSVSLPQLNALLQKLAKQSCERSWKSRNEFWSWLVGQSQEWAGAENYQLGRLELMFADEKWISLMNQPESPVVFRRRRVVCVPPVGQKVSGWFESQTYQTKNKVPKEFRGSPKDLVHQFKGSFTEFTSRRQWIS